MAEVAPRYGFARFGLSVPEFAIVSIAVLVVAVAAILWLTRGNLLFAATAICALIAIAAAEGERNADPSVLVALLIALVTVLASTTWLSLIYRQRRSSP